MVHAHIDALHGLYLGTAAPVDSRSPDAVRGGYWRGLLAKVRGVAHDPNGDAGGAPRPPGARKSSSRRARGSSVSEGALSGIPAAEPAPAHAEAAAEERTTSIGRSHSLADRSYSLASRSYSLRQGAAPPQQHPPLARRDVSPHPSMHFGTGRWTAQQELGPDAVEATLSDVESAGRCSDEEGLEAAGARLSGGAHARSPMGPRAEEEPQHHRSVVGRLSKMGRGGAKALGRALHPRSGKARASSAGSAGRPKGADVGR